MSDSLPAIVLTPEIRGHGANKGEKGDISYIGQLEEDMEAVIGYCERQFAVTRIILIGHSSGGGFVLRFIGNPNNTKVNAAVLLAPYLAYDAPTVKHNSGNWVTVAVKRRVGLSMLNGIGISALDGLPVLFFNRPERYNDSLQATEYSYRMAVNFGPKKNEREIRNIDLPSLVLVGAKDESFYPEKFRAVFQPAEAWVRTEALSEANHLDIVKRAETLHHILPWMKEQ